MPEKITRRMAAATAPRDVRYDLADEIRGLCLRVRPAGSKTWVLRYRMPGEGRSAAARDFLIGRYPDLTPEQAREIAQQIKADIARGIDPAIERRRLARSRPALATVEAVLDSYMRSLHGRPGYHPAESVARLHIKPQIGRTAVDEITTGAVKKVVRELERKGMRRTGGQVVAILRAAWRAAWDGGQLPRTLADPTAGIAAHVWKKRRRVATFPELRAVMAAIAELWRRGADPYGLGWMLLLILTGARPSEIGRARWDDVDLEAGTITLDRHKTADKTGDARVIVLAPSAVALLISLPRVKGWPWVIAGRTKDAPRATYHRLWVQILEEAKVTGLTPRDLRRTFASIGLGFGFGLDQLGGVLGHSSVQTTAGYAFLQKTPAVTIATAIADSLSALAPSGLLPTRGGSPADREAADPPG